MFPTPAMPSWPGGRRMVAMRRGSPRIAPQHMFTGQSPDLPLNGAQVVTTLSGSGTAQGQVGPSGIGTVWSPASATFSTSVTPFDGASILNLYIGPSNVPNTLIGTVLGGNGTIAIALPPMTPGLYLIAVWSQGTAGSTVSMNVVGTYTTLVR